MQKTHGIPSSIYQLSLVVVLGVGEGQSSQIQKGSLWLDWHLHAKSA